MKMEKSTKIYAEKQGTFILNLQRSEWLNKVIARC